jgi:glyoxylase-like metal-dependent hydrolase (beta-lactamase superfamily II)
MSIPCYEIFAVRYATHDRSARDNFIFTDGIFADLHDGPMPMDYMVWGIRGSAGCFVVDTGFNEAVAKARRRRFLGCPVTALEAIGFERGTVRDVIVTHLHYDHAGNLDLYPNARFHIQDEEIAYATGRFMGHEVLRRPFDVEDIVRIVRHVHAGRVVFHRGDDELAPGVTVHRIGGHTGGLQVVRVHTRRGWVVLASDASHYYANKDRGNPYPLVHHVGEMLEGFRILERLADGPDHIIPGHDPAVLRRYPRIDGMRAEVVRLDLPPAG